MKDSGTVPAGQVEKVARAAIPPPGGTNIVDFCECLCPITDDPCFYYTCQNCSCQPVYPRGNACEDGNACTYGDTCDGNGTCKAGTSYTCTGDQCKSAACDGRGGCSSTPRTGAACNDGIACTYGERCSSTGTCSGGTTVSCVSDTCATRACNGTASCAVTPNTGVGCQDNDPCTYNDTCTAQGTCGAGQRLTCTSDTCNNRECQGTATCKVTPKTGSACEDGQACTYGDTCNAQGACASGATITCDSDQCAVRMCNGTSTCSVVPRTGITCNDGQPCTYGETCNNAGQCAGGTTVTCASDTCNLRECNGTASCRVTSRPGVRCDDQQACTYDDTCTSDGSCGGTSLTCTSDQYADRSCNGSATCTVVPKPGAACDDGNDCTKGDVLQGDGSCRGMAYTCALGECLESSTCDGKGGCTQVAKMDGTGCNADSSKCTPKDVCRGGVCVPDPTPVKCIERECNTVACDAETGDCEYAPKAGTCGVSGCFTAGVCNEGTCSGTPKDCTSLDGPCTAGLCDAATGACVATPKLNGTDCSSGGMCTSSAACAFGVCVLAGQSCPAATSPCKEPACNAADGKCVEASKPPGAACDPKNSCVSDAMCDETGACRGTPALNGSPCTLAGGAVGECAAGTCVALGPTGPKDAGGGSDGPPTGNSDAGPDAGTGGMMKPPSGGKSGCSIGAAGDPATPWALLMLAIAVVAVRRRRR